MPEVAIITPIDFDHENFLGHSIEEIAAEKAGIIKPGAWVVSASERSEARAVIARRCAEMDARLVEVDATARAEDVQTSDGLYRAVAAFAHSRKKLTLAPSLPGRFQIRNALTAAIAARLLAERGFPLPDAAIERGIAAANWPGRLERLATQPDLYLDGAHNPAGARELLKFWQENYAVAASFSSTERCAIKRSMRSPACFSLTQPPSSLRNHASHAPFPRRCSLK